MSGITFDLFGRDVSASDTLDKFADKADGTSKRTGAAFSAMKVALAGAAVAIIGIGKSSIDAFEDAETSQRKLTDAYARFPALADVNISKLREQAAALQEKTKFDGDQINASQATLAQYGLTGKQLQELTPLMLDYAEKTGKDLPSAAEDLGKALLGQGRALKDIGLNFKNTGSVSGNLAELTGGLRTQVGGFAEKEGKSAAGQAAILHHNIEDVQEEIGSKLLPVLTRLTTALIESLKWMEDHSTAVKIAAIVVGSLALVLGIAVGIMALQSAALTIASAAVAVWSGVTATATGIAWLFNAALTANPIGLVILALAGLIAVLVLAYEKVDWFRAFVDASFHAIKDAVSAAIDWIRQNWPLLLAILTGPIGLAVLAIATHWESIKNGAGAAVQWVKDRFGDLVGFFTGLPGQFANASRGMFNGMANAFISALNVMIRGWNSISFTLPSVDTHIPGVGRIGGWTLSTPDINQIQGLADSGTVLPRGPAGTLVRLAERGRPESVVDTGLLNKRLAADSGGGDTYLTVNAPLVWGGSNAELGRWIVGQIEAHVKQGGTAKIATGVV